MIHRPTISEVTARPGNFAVIRAATFTGSDLTAAYQEYDLGQDVTDSLDPMARAVFDEAIALGTRGLSESETHSETLSLRHSNARFRYLVRMSARTTPLGLFATFGWGAVKGRREPRLVSLEKSRRRTRPDGGALAIWIESLLKSNSETREERLLSTNPMAIQYGARWHSRMAGFRTLGAQRVDLFADSLELRMLLESAKSLRAEDEIVAELSSRSSSEIDWHAYIAEALEAGLLTSWVPIGIPQRSPYETLDIVSARWPESGPGRAADKLREACNKMDSAGPGQSVSASDSIREELAQNAPLSSLIQVDYFRQPEHGIACSEVLAKEIATTAASLWNIAPSSGRPLRSFVQEFDRRYGEQFVPLLVALDEERGLGWTLRIRTPPISTATRVETLESIAAISQRTKALVWHPSDSECRQLAEPKWPVTSRLAAVFTPASGCDSLESTERGVLERIGGNSATGLIARFLADEPGLLTHVRSWLASDDEAIAESADIHFLPTARLSNVLAHPPISRIGIAFDSAFRSSDQQIVPVSDLVVTVRSDEIEIWSRSLNRRLRPVLRNAHSYDNDSVPPAYRFLALCANDQSEPQISWNWGRLAASAPFLPRIVLGSIAVSRAQWRIPKDCKDQNILEWAKHLYIDENIRWVQAGRSDRWRPYDLATDSGLKLLCHDVMRQNLSIVQELYPAPEKFAYESDRGRHNAELVLPLTLQHESATRIPQQPPLTRWVNKEAGDGRSWVSYNVFCGGSIQDELFSAIPAAPEYADGSAPHFFVVRYSDPAPHLRIRYLISDAWSATRIREWQYDVIERVSGTARLNMHEVEYRPERWRYGGASLIAFAEDVFCAESRFLASSFTELCLCGDGDERLATLTHLNAMCLAAWFHDIVSAEKWLASCVGRDFAARDAARTHPREVAVRTWTQVSAVFSQKPLPGQVDALITNYASALRAYREEFHRIHAWDREALTANADSIIASLLHMSANRVYRRSGSMTERTVLVFLHNAVRRIRHTSVALSPNLTA